MRSKALEHFLLPAQQDRIVTYTHSSTSHLRGLFFPYSPYIVQFSEEKRMMGKNTEKYFRIFGMIIFKWYTESFRGRDTREVKAEL